MRSFAVARPYNINPGVLFVLLGAVCFGTTGTAQAFAPQGCQPLVVGTMRLVVGGLVMLTWVKLRSGFRKDIPWPKRATVAAAVGIVAFQLFFFGALARTGVAVGTVVAIGSGPIAGGIIDYFMRGVKPGRIWYAATSLGLCGLVLLSFGAEVMLDPVGMLMALGAGAGYALYAANSQILLADRGADEVVAMLFAVGGIVMSPLLFVYDVSWIASAQGLGAMLFLGVIGTAMAHGFFAAGLGRLTLSSGLTLGLAEPLVAALLGIFVLGEACTLQTGMGLFVMFAGMYVMARNP